MKIEEKNERDVVSPTRGGGGVELLDSRSERSLDRVECGIDLKCHFIKSFSF